MKTKRAATTIEILVVIIIISILVTISFVSYGSGREKILDKETISNLKLLQSAQKAYKAENMTSYYGNQSDIGQINYNLKVSLPAGTTRAWNYTVNVSGCVNATRNVTSGRGWVLTINDADGEPDAGAGCP